MKHIFIITLWTLFLSFVTLNFAYAAKAALPRTGQVLCYNNTTNAVTDCAYAITTGQDGNKLKGAVWPVPRFTDNGNFTVTDNLTGLIWLKNANCFVMQNWATALATANALASGACGLTDGSTPGQWRLPNNNELMSLVDISYSNPVFPTTAGFPFWQIQSDKYWSSSTSPSGGSVWFVNMNDGSDDLANKTSTGYVWPVRVY